MCYFYRRIYDLKNPNKSHSIDMNFCRYFWNYMNRKVSHCFYYPDIHLTHHFHYLYPPYRFHILVNSLLNWPDAHIYLASVQFFGLQMTEC